MEKRSSLDEHIEKLENENIDATTAKLKLKCSEKAEWRAAVELKIFIRAFQDM